MVVTLSLPVVADYPVRKTGTSSERSQAYHQPTLCPATEGLTHCERDSGENPFQRSKKFAHVYIDRVPFS